MTEDVLAALRRETEAGGKVLRWFETEIRAADGTLVAKVRKQLYVRRKNNATFLPQPRPEAPRPETPPRGSPPRDPRSRSARFGGHGMDGPGGRPTGADDE